MATRPTQTYLYTAPDELAPLSPNDSPHSNVSLHCSGTTHPTKPAKSHPAGPLIFSSMLAHFRSGPVRSGCSCVYVGPRPSRFGAF